MRRLGIVLALALSAAVVVVLGGAPASADGHDDVVPEVCDDLGAPGELCLPARMANAVLVPLEPDGPIEARYSETGPWSVVFEPEVACCDSAGNAYDVVRPRHLGVAGMTHPIITWGNGSGGQPENYEYFLRHVASWGFVVVATNEEATGSGREVLDAAEFAVAENEDRFGGHLATGRIGAMGHSQGAAGAVAAMNLSDGLIRTAVPLHMPDPYGCGSPPGSEAEACRDLYRGITSGSIFFVTGTFDVPISTAEGNAEYYGHVPDGIPKAKGSLRGTSHNDIQGDPGCTGTTSVGCFNGAYGYLGYPVAWMMDRLADDTFARGAFVSGGAGEIFENRNWTEQATAGIPPAEQ